MADLATLLADLEALKSLRRSGERHIKYQGPNGTREVIFANDTELSRAIAATEAEIAALQGQPVVRNINLRSRGWS